MRLDVSRCRRVVEIAPQPRRQRGEDDGDADSTSDEDIVKDAIVGGIGTEKVVDTDDEASAGSLGSSSSEDEVFLEKLILAKPLNPGDTGEAATGASTSEAADTGAKKTRRQGFEPLWQDPYFTVWSHPNVDFVRAMMRDVWRAPAPGGMGTSNVTRQVTARHYGEGTDDPVRSVLLLRAWALWRAAQGGWAYSQRGRARHFREQEVLLERDIKALNAPCRLLGDTRANTLLRSWVPQLVVKLRD